MIALKKSPFSKHHNNLFRQYSSVNGKTKLKVCGFSGIYVIYKCLPTRYLFISHKRKRSTIREETPRSHHLYQGMGVNLTAMGTVGLVFLWMEFTQNRRSLLWGTCQIPDVTNEETSDRLKVKCILQNYWPLY